MPKPLLPVLERALRRFETDTGARPRTVYLTPKQIEQLTREIGGALGGHLTEILGVKVVTARDPKAARIRAALGETDTAEITTATRPNGAVEARVRAFGSAVHVHVPTRFSISGRSSRVSTQESLMGRDELLDLAAKYFADNIDDHELLRAELRLRPKPPLRRDMARNRARTYDRYWLDEAATVDPNAFMNTTISAAQLTPTTISTRQIWNSTVQTTANAPAAYTRSATEMLTMMEEARRAMEQAERPSGAMARLRNEFIQSAYQRERDWAMRDPALTGLTESAPTRRATSAGTPEFLPPTLRSPSRDR